jgi:hypothetical protein
VTGSDRSGDAHSDPVVSLRRWEQFGAKWRVVGDAASVLSISLCRCDSDEEVDRLISADPALRAYIAGRASSD